MAEPQEIPRNPNDSYVLLTWAEGGAVNEPTSGKKNTGWIAEVVDKETLNWTSRDAMRFTRAIVARYPQAAEGFFTSWLVRNGVWANGFGALEGFLSDALVTDSLVADVWLDPADIDTGAVRIQVSVPLASPFTFIANRDTYVFVPIDVVVPPTATLADLIFLDVPVSDPPPATPAGTVPVWRVETDGAAIVDQEILVPTVPILKTVGITEAAIMGNVEVGGNLDVMGNLSVTGTSTLEDVLTVNAAATVNGMTSVNGTLMVDGTLSVINDNPASFTGNVTLGDGAGDAIVVQGTTNVNAPATFNSTLTANGNVNLGNDPADALTINATVTFGANTITGAGGTITTSTVNGSTVGATVINFNTTTPSGTNGRLVYNGRRLSVGDGLSARRLMHPLTAYVVSHTTTAATTDITGATISMDIDDDEWVFFRVSAIQDVDTAGQDPKIRLAATNGVDNVTILNLGDVDQAQLTLPSVAANNDRSPNIFTVRWKPTNDVITPDNTSWVIRVQHGVTGGVTLISSNVFLEGWYE